MKEPDSSIFPPTATASAEPMLRTTNVPSVFNVMMIKALLARPELIRIYLCMCVIAGLTCMMDGTINGPAELIYAISISVLLYRA